MKNRLIKKEVCPKCGREHHGFYINPVCLCGHQLRDLNGWEIRCLGGEVDEFQSLSVFEKRYLLREIEWNSRDLMWQGGFGVFILVHYFILLFRCGDIMAEHIAATIVAAVAGIIIGGYMLGIIAKTIYFRWLKKMDTIFFMNN